MDDYNEDHVNIGPTWVFKVTGYVVDYLSPSFIARWMWVADLGALIVVWLTTFAVDLDGIVDFIDHMYLWIWVLSAFVVGVMTRIASLPILHLVGGMFIYAFSATRFLMTMQYYIVSKSIQVALLVSFTLEVTMYGSLVLVQLVWEKFVEK